MAVSSNDTLMFDPLFIRPCIFPVLADLDYETSLSINNGLIEGPYATEMKLRISFVSESGQYLGTKALNSLSPGEVMRVNAEEEMSSMSITPSGRMLGVVHSIPNQFLDMESVEIERSLISAHVAASDDFIEFRQKPKGVITGVAYQMGPQNDVRFNKTRTTLLQAPKIVISHQVDTLFALMNVSTSFNYSDSAEIDFWILDPDGSRTLRSQLFIPPWTVRYISISEVLKAEGVFDAFVKRGGKGMLLGLSQNCGLVPLSLTRNQVTGAIACDHTLPPVYYFSNWGGKLRLEANEQLKHLMFS